MKFLLPRGGPEYMDQTMMYTHDDKDFWYNYTGNVQLGDYFGVYKNEGGDGETVQEYHRFWSSIWAVGTWEGKRWFGWYFCGPAVEVTRKGIPWVVKESYDYDDQRKNGGSRGPGRRIGVLL